MSEAIKAENGLQVFEHEKFGKVRVVRVESEIWFSGKDVATVLGYTNPARSVQDHCKHAKLFRTTDLVVLNNINDLQLNPRGELFINQADVLRLIARSTLPEAQKVESWIFDDVMVKVLNTGSYSLTYNLPQTHAEALRALADEVEERERVQLALDAAEQKISEDRPKVIFADSVEVSKTSILIGELAKLIKQATGYDIGQNRFFTWLRDHGYLHKSGSQYNHPTQKSMNMGLMEVKEGTRIGSGGEIHIIRTPKITGKGQIYFVNLFKAKAAVEEF